MATGLCTVSSAEWKPVFHRCMVLLCKCRHLYGTSLLPMLGFLIQISQHMELNIQSLQSKIIIWEIFLLSLGVFFSVLYVSNFLHSRKLKSYTFFHKMQNKKSPILASGHLEKQKFITACKVITNCQKEYSAF